MKNRDVIWMSMMLAFIFVVASQIYRENITFVADIPSYGELAVLACCVVLVGLLSRRFVRENFDDEGNWVGRLIRRRKPGDRSSD